MESKYNYSANSMIPFSVNLCFFNATSLGISGIKNKDIPLNSNNLRKKMFLFLLFLLPLLSKFI